MKKLFLTLLCMSLSALNVSANEAPPLRVIATTSIIADFVKAVGGDRVAIDTLVGPDSDPHAFEPTPRDVANMIDADIVFANGLGLEAFMDSMKRKRAEKMNIVRVGEGLTGLLTAHDHDHDHDHGHGHGQHDPHIWFDPNMALRALAAIREALVAADPENADAYAANQRAYAGKIYVLDLWIQSEVRKIPDHARKIICDHHVLGYFCKRYGIEEAGVISESGSSLASPSARDMARIIETIKASDARTVLVGYSVNPKLAQRIADDAGARIVRIYTGSLSAPDGPAGDYLSFMRYNVKAICEAMQGASP